MTMTKTVMSTYHPVIKFSMEEGIGEIRDNQLMTKECYFATVKGKQKAKEIFIVSSNNLAK